MLHKKEQGSIDIDAVTLYATYILWVKFYGKNKIVYIQFAKELKRLGYENYGENVPGHNYNKKIAKLVEIHIRCDVKDKLIPKNDDQACPIYTELLVTEKTNLG
jgi:hypothetical protein